MMTQRYLEDFAVGQTFGSGRLRIDRERSQRFAARRVLRVSVSSAGAALACEVAIGGTPPYPAR